MSKGSLVVAPGGVTALRPPKPPPPSEAALRQRWQTWARATIERTDRILATLPDRTDFHQRRMDDVAQERIDREMRRNLSEGDYGRWKSLHAKTLKARDDYRAAVDEANKAAKEFKKKPTESNRAKADRLAKEAEEKRKELESASFAEEEAANGGSVSCGEAAAEWCVEKNHDKCDGLPCPEEECECKLVGITGQEWNPEKQKEIREKQKEKKDKGKENGAKKGGGGGGGQAVAPPGSAGDDSVGPAEGRTVAPPPKPPPEDEEAEEDRSSRGSDRRAVTPPGGPVDGPRIYAKAEPPQEEEEEERKTEEEEKRKEEEEEERKTEEEEKRKEEEEKRRKRKQILTRLEILIFVLERYLEERPPNEKTKWLKKAIKQLKDQVELEFADTIDETHVKIEIEYIQLEKDQKTPIKVTKIRISEEDWRTDMESLSGELVSLVHELAHVHFANELHIAPELHHPTSGKAREEDSHVAFTKFVSTTHDALVKDAFVQAASLKFGEALSKPDADFEAVKAGAAATANAILAEVKKREERR